MSATASWFLFGLMDLFCFHLRNISPFLYLTSLFSKGVHHHLSRLLRGGISGSKKGSSIVVVVVKTWWELIHDFWLSGSVTTCTQQHLTAYIYSMILLVLAISLSSRSTSELTLPHSVSFFIFPSLPRANKWRLPSFFFGRLFLLHISHVQRSRSFFSFSFPIQIVMNH